MTLARAHNRDTVPLRQWQPTSIVSALSLESVKIVNRYEVHKRPKTTVVFETSFLLAKPNGYPTFLGRRFSMGMFLYSNRIGISSLSSSNFKNRERESGKAVEEVARESCQRFNDEEKRLSSTGEEEVVKVGVSYDMGWRKRGRSDDSSSGVRTAVGLQTGKVISYATRNTICRVCAEAQKKNQEADAHDCRKNHPDSSKSMEANVAVELFSGALSSGVAYTTYVGNDDSATESHLKTLVTYDIEKWSDINHASRALGTRL